MGHAIRELMAPGQIGQQLLSGTVEMDDKFIGGEPRYQEGVVQALPNLVSLCVSGKFTIALIGFTELLSVLNFRERKRSVLLIFHSLRHILRSNSLGRIYLETSHAQ
jgi:hypothetical protein